MRDMKTLLALVATCFAALAFAAAPALPSYVSVPVPVPADDVNHSTYEQHEFTLRDKTEIHRGKYWNVYVDYTQKLGEDNRKALVAFIDSMRKAGWEVVLQDIPRNPPLATFHYTKNGKDAWAAIQTGEQAKITVVESGAPPKLDLAPPARSGGKVASNADFPYLKHFPGSKLADTAQDDRPMLVQIEEDKEPVQIASGSIRKQYDGPAWLGSIEPIVTYLDALKRAGWKIVEENTAVTTGDPYLTAHYAKDTTDIWVHVHSRGNDGYYVNVADADAGAERGAARVKAELDKSCKVQVYGISFDFDKSTLRPDSEAALNSILQVFNAYPDLALELAGHTDNVGKPDYNARLSEARVNTVRGWLVGKGVKAERITAKGYGDTQPIASNDSPEGRAKNRRVELRKRGC